MGFVRRPPDARAFAAGSWGSLPTRDEEGESR